ncbi:MAG: helix-turn-helix domain-containing protein [Pirellulales bacterium]
MNNPFESSSQDQSRLAYRPREAAEKLGISLSSLDRLTKQGEIPVSRVGPFRLYPHEALVEWINSKAK